MTDAPARSPQRPDAEVSAEDRAALAENVDLDVDMRRRVLHTHRALERLTHYELLGVEPNVDAKALKRVYYQLAATFHPDRYFRKSLGSFKVRMEVIFGRLTLAYETLSSPERREEYDRYVEEQRRARGIEELLAQAVAEAKRAEEIIEREVMAETAVPGPLSVATPLAPIEPARPTPPPPNVDVSARRDALARRLRGGRGPATTRPPPAPTPVPSSPVPTVADAMAALRRRYEDRVARAKANQARKYVASGEAALAAGDAVSAANAFRVALTLSPADRNLEHAAREAQSKADELLSETYARQAAYEEKNGQWAEAARSWTRVCKARPNDAHAHEHGANAITKANGDLREASQLATRACTLEPANPRFRVLLANVFLAAGMIMNARRELERAAQLAPHDDTIQSMMKMVGK